MTELILHHYPESLFSEKARAMLNAKGLGWRSVIIPMIMPRPDTIPLTGGYRRTPVMQVGADVYCDTALIAAYLDDKGTGKTLFPADHRLAAQTLARWVDTELFWASVTLRFLPQNMGSFFSNAGAAEAFAADRAKFAQGAKIRRPTADEALATYRTFLAEMEAQLADGRAFLFGADWSIADFSTYHVLWFIHVGGAMADVLDGHSNVASWYLRMKVFGDKPWNDLSGPDALSIALASAPVAVVETSDLTDIPVGSCVDVGPLDYGVMPTRGTLVKCDTHSIVVRRKHALTGPINVHFPRHGFGVTRAA